MKKLLLVVAGTWLTVCVVYAQNQPSVQVQSNGNANFDARQRPAWCKNAKLPHELAICEDAALSRNELEILSRYQDFAKKSGLATELLREHRLEFFNKIKACGADKFCILNQQNGRLQTYASLTGVGENTREKNDSNIGESRAGSIAKTVAYLGLPHIKSKRDFVAYFGSCGDDSSMQDLGVNALREAAFTCVSKGFPECANDVKVDACKLVRFAFDKNEATAWAFVSLGGFRAVSRAPNVYQTIYGKQEPTSGQANGFVEFDFAWSPPGLRIEINTLIDVSNIKGPNNAALVWVVPN